jgi:hypothetical protein
MEEGWRRLIDEQWLRDCMENWCDYGHLIVRAKWTMDGATTLAEAARAFRERAEKLVRPGGDSPMRLVEEDE